MSFGSSFDFPLGELDHENHFASNFANINADDGVDWQSILPLPDCAQLSPYEAPISPNLSGASSPQSTTSDVDDSLPSTPISTSWGDSPHLPAPIPLPLCGEEFSYLPIGIASPENVAGLTPLCDPPQNDFNFNFTPRFDWLPLSPDSPNSVNMACAVPPPYGWRDGAFGMHGCPSPVTSDPIPAPFKRGPSTLFDMDLGEERPAKRQRRQTGPTQFSCTVAGCPKGTWPVRSPIILAGLCPLGQCSHASTIAIHTSRHTSTYARTPARLLGAPRNHSPGNTTATGTISRTTPTSEHPARTSRGARRSIRFMGCPGEHHRPFYPRCTLTAYVTADPRIARSSSIMPLQSGAHL